MVANPMQGRSYSGGVRPWACLVLSSVLSFCASASLTGVPKHWGGPRFDGKRIMVTGGDSGIGLAAVGVFYWECGSVMMIGHNETKTREAWSNLMKLPAPTGCSVQPRMEWTAIDTSNITAVDWVVNLTVSRLGGLDVGVNNAGSINSKKKIGDAGFPADFMKSPELNVNILGTLSCMNAQLRYWQSNPQNGASIINIGSICGETAYCPGAYSTSKWSMTGFTKNAALTYAKQGIRVNIVDPGLVNTPMLRGGMAEDDPEWIARKKTLEKNIPMGRIAEPWEIAGPIAFLASDMSSYVTGQALTPDGAVTIGSPWKNLLDQSMGAESHEILV